MTGATDLIEDETTFIKIGRSQHLRGKGAPKLSDTLELFGVGNANIAPNFR
jgi:hypothetical protein